MKLKPMSIGVSVALSLLITQNSFAAIACKPTSAGVQCYNDCSLPQQDNATLEISVAPYEQVQRMTFDLNSATNGRGSPTISTLNDQGYTDYHLAEKYSLNTTSAGGASCVPNWLTVNNCIAVYITNKTQHVNCFTALNFKFSPR